MSIQMSIWMVHWGDSGVEGNEGLNFNADDTVGKCYCWMCHGLELLGQRFRGHIHCAVSCELALCQSNAPEAISIVLCSVVPGLCLDHPSECSIV